MRQTVPQSHIPGGRPVLLKYTGDGGSKARSQQGRLNSLDSLLPNFCLAPRRKHSFPPPPFLGQSRSDQGPALFQDLQSHLHAHYPACLRLLQSRSGACTHLPGLGRTPALPQLLFSPTTQPQHSPGKGRLAELPGYKLWAL